MLIVIAVETARGEAESKRPKLSKETQTKLAQILLQLAGTAQYSKVQLCSTLTFSMHSAGRDFSNPITLCIPVLQTCLRVGRALLFCCSILLEDTNALIC